VAEGTRLLSEYGVSSPIEGSNPSLSVTKRLRPVEDREPAWRLPFVGAGEESETIYLRRKAPWRGSRLPAVGERMNILALHTTEQVERGLIRFNLTIASVEWGVIFEAEPYHMPLFTFEPVEGDQLSLQWLLEAGWQPDSF
jgi:hypothetical protein